MKLIKKSIGLIFLLSFSIKGIENNVDDLFYTIFNNLDDIHAIKELEQMPSLVYKVKNSNGDSLLHHALRYNKSERIIDFLLNNSFINLYYKNFDGKTAVEVAHVEANDKKQKVVSYAKFYDEPIKNQSKVENIFSEHLKNFRSRKFLYPLDKKDFSQNQILNPIKKYRSKIIFENNQEFEEID